MTNNTSTPAHCPSWCEDYGTPHEEFCAGVGRGVLLTLEQPVLDSSGVSATNFEAYPLREHDGTTAVVNTTVNGMRGPTLSINEARLVAVALMAAADDADHSDGAAS